MVSYRLMLGMVLYLGLFAGGSPQAAMPLAPPIVAALADPERPATDRARDGDRKPSQILVLTGVETAARVVDIGPGSGYYTRLLSRVVGSGGKVFAFNPTWLDTRFPKAKEGITALVAAGYTNIENRIQPMAEIHFEAPVDLVFMSQLYHDQHVQKIDIARMNRAIFAALKPGGVYFIVDHCALPGATEAQVTALHRIDPAVVKREAAAAGFVLEAASNLLKNDNDPGNIPVFDPTIRGKTNQFVLKFRKPDPH